MIRRYRAERLVFSLDLYKGTALTKTGWKSADPWEIAVRAVRASVNKMLVLDLAAVGSDQGTPTTALCISLRTAFPTLEITTGGGIRNAKDLRRLQQAGVNNVLIASALHDGKLTRTEVEEFS